MANPHHPKCFTPILAENSTDASKLDADLKESTPSDEEAVCTKTFNTRRKRQKFEAEPANTQEGQAVKPSRLDKYVRGRRGHLKLMTEMPIDTLHEMFRLLDPLDLLYLSWANKSLRAIIMEKSARYIWEQAYERLYKSNHPPPRCPRDVNFAQYTRFLYHKKCIVCDIRNGSHTSWEMRLRACYQCLRHSDRFTVVYFDYEERRRLLFRASKLITLLSPLWRLMPLSPGKSAFIEAGTPPCGNVQQRRMGINHFDAWQERCSDDRLADLDRRRAERVDAIFKKLGKIGWSEAEIKEINNDELPHDLPGFGTVKKLTNKDWANIQPHIVEVLTEKKKGHLERLERKHLEQRWTHFETKFEEWTKTQILCPSIMPRAIDISIQEPFNTAIFASDIEEAEFKIDDIDRVAKEWIEWRENFIFSLLPQELQDRYQANKPSLQPLAILRFSSQWFLENSTLKSARSMRKSTYGPLLPPLTPDKRKIHEAVDKSRLSDVLPWKWNFLDLRFETEGFEAAVGILKFLGMDPYTTTLTSVSECKQRFQCVECEYSRPFTCVDMFHHDFYGHNTEIKKGVPVATWWTRVDDKTV